MEEGLSQSALRTALVLASLAAVVVLAGLFSDAIRYGCLAVIIIATLVTAGERSRGGGGWWAVLGAGAALSAVGAGISEVSETIGGLIAVVGGVLVVVGAAIGFPADELEYE
ncbi:MAG: hypothetical protein M3331_07710 [Actinomycetota bacterium]|nr:hypothetical protein [Actinomycetota bacterium]